MNLPISRNSILSRAELRPEERASPLQSQVDGLVGGFAEQATDWRSLASMMAGGVAYRFGRVGLMGLGNGSTLRIASVGLGLTAEVSTFELTQRGLSSLQDDNPNRWSWNGPGGLRQGLLQSFVTFGALKGAGRLAQGENFIAQHLFQDTAMVLGHQVTGALGIAPRPTGSLAEQFLHAEATNLQMGAGMALAHSVAPGVQGLERGLDLMTSLEGEGGRRLGEGYIPRRYHPALAMAGRGEPVDVQSVYAVAHTPDGGGGPPRFPRRQEVEALLSELRHFHHKNGGLSPKAQRAREGIHQIFDRAWSHHRARWIRLSQWQALGRSISYQLLKTKGIDGLPPTPLIEAMAEHLYAEIHYLGRRGVRNPATFAPYLSKISASEIAELSKHYPQFILSRAIKTTRPRIGAGLFMRDHRIAYETAEAMLSEIPEAPQIAQLIADYSFHRGKNSAGPVAARYVRSWQEAYAAAREALQELPEGEKISRSIARSAFSAADPKARAREYVARWRESHQAALEILEGFEEGPQSARSIAGMTYYSKEWVAAARRKTLISVLGCDPRYEVNLAGIDVFTRRVLRTGSSSAEGKEFLAQALEGTLVGRALQGLLEQAESADRTHYEKLMEEMADGVTSLEEALERVRTFQESYLNGSMREEEWEGSRDFSRQEEESVSRKTTGRLRLSERDLFQGAPLFKRSSEMIGWLLENQERIQRLAESGKTFTYPSMAKALNEAGKISEHSHRFLTIASVLQYASLLSRHPELESLLPPSVSFRRLLEKGKKALSEAERARTVPPAAPPEPLGPWREPVAWEPLNLMLTRFRAETHLERAEIVALLEQCGLKSILPSTLGEYEMGSATPGLEVLNGLAQIYGKDVRDLIYSANRTRFSSTRLAPRHWLAETYPLWIEGLSDLKMILHLRKTDPDHQSLGWKITAARRNPIAYRNRVQLAEQVRISRPELEELEYNRRKPLGSTIVALAKALQIPEPELAAAAERIRPVERSAGTLGQVLFEHRKTLSGLPTGHEMAERLGEHKSFWLMRETNEVVLRIENLHEWVDLFQRAQIPLERLDPFLAPLGLTRESPAYLLALVRRGEGVESLSERSGVETRILTLMLKFGRDHQRSLSPEWIVSLKRALPDLDAARLYRVLQPGILRFIPEANENPPVLRMSEEEAQVARDFDLALALVAFRTKHGMDKKTLAGRLGVTPRMIQLYESGENRIQKEETLLKAAQVLGVDPKVLYLNLHAEVWDLFPLVNPSPLTVNRRIVSTDGTEYPFELFLPPFPQVLAAEPGTEFHMAQRGAHPIMLEVGSREEISISNSFFPAGIPVYRYILKEGKTRGVAIIMDEPGVISAFAIDTVPAWNAAPSMAPGAGSIAMEWLATQAALQRKELHILHIGNYQILNILNRQGLLDPESIQVEACRWKNQEFQLFDVEETFSLSDTQALRRNMTPDFWNVLGRPHPRLAEGLIDPLILGNTPRK